MMSDFVGVNKFYVSLSK